MQGEGTALRPPITAEEFAHRRRQAADMAARRGYAGLLVCSRGGGTLDRYADVKYLANAYSPFPYIPDVPGSWSGRAHTLLVLPANAAPELIFDIPDDGTVQIHDGRVCQTETVVEASVEALRRCGMTAGRIGLVGYDVMPLSMHEAIASALPDLEWEAADDIVGDLRAVKSDGEVAALRGAAEVGSRVVEAMLEAALPGARHGDVVAVGLQVLLPEGGILYNAFMASGRGGPAPKVVRSQFPTWGARERLEAGDWITLGISGAVDGYIFDLARSKSVGAAASRHQVDVFEAAIAAVEAAIATIRPGATAHDVAAAGLGKQKELGYEPKSTFSGMGHGIGLGWDSPWLTIGNTAAIVPSMVLCVERTVSHAGEVGDFEEMVLVTENGVEKLTDAAVRFW